MTPTHSTLHHLRRLQMIRAAGCPVSFTTDPAWLVQQAINRRGGYLDDPSLLRGSALPVNGRYPSKASGDSYTHLRLISREINTARLIVRAQRLGEWRKYLIKRIPGRIEQ